MILLRSHRLDILPPLKRQDARIQSGDQGTPLIFHTFARTPPSAYAADCFMFPDGSAAIGIHPGRSAAVRPQTIDGEYMVMACGSN